MTLKKIGAKIIEAGKTPQAIFALLMILGFLVFILY